MSQERELLREALPCLESAFRIVTMGDGYPSAVERDNTGLINRIRALLDEPEEMSERQNRSDIDSERSDEREPEYVWRVTVFPEGKHPASFRLEFGDALRAEQNIEMPCVVERALIGKWEAVDE